MEDHKSGKRRINDDEVDILVFFRAFGNFLVRILTGFFKIFLLFIIHIFKSWGFIITGALTGIVIAVLLTLLQKEVFESSLILKSNAVENQEMISYIDRLQSLTHDQNYSSLGESLGVDYEIAVKIKDINAYWFIDRNKDGIVDGADPLDRFLADTNIRKVDWKFGINVKTVDPEIFDEIETGLKNYVNNNVYFSRMNENRLENLNHLISKTQIEIEKLDSLEKNEYFRTQEQTRLLEGQLVFTNDPVIQLFHNDLLTLVKDMMNRQTEFKINNGIVTILEDFIVNRRPRNSVVFYSKIFVPVFSGLALLIALIIRFRKDISRMLST